MKKLALAAALSTVAVSASAAQMSIVTVDYDFNPVGEPEITDTGVFGCEASMNLIVQKMRQSYPRVEDTYLTAKDGIKFYLVTPGNNEYPVLVGCID